MQPIHDLPIFLQRRPTQVACRNCLRSQVGGSAELAGNHHSLDGPRGVLFSETTCNESQGVNTQKRRASRKATRSTGPKHARKRDARNELDGNHQAVFDLRHTRNSTTLQSALPEAHATDATKWVALSPQLSCCYKRICAASTVVEGRPTQVAHRNFLRSTSATPVAHFWCAAQSSGATWNLRGILHVCACPRKLEVEPLLIVPGLVCALSPMAAGTTLMEPWRKRSH